MTLEEFILAPHRPYLASRAANKSIYPFFGIYRNVNPYFANPSCFGFKSHQLTTIYFITVQDVGVENMKFRFLPETLPNEIHSLDISVYYVSRNRLFFNDLGGSIHDPLISILTIGMSFTRFFLFQLHAFVLICHMGKDLEHPETDILSFN